MYSAVSICHELGFPISGLIHLREMGAYSGEATVNFGFASFLKEESSLKGKNLLPLGANSFL